MKKIYSLILFAFLISCQSSTGKRVEEEPETVVSTAVLQDSASNYQEEVVLEELRPSIPSGFTTIEDYLVKEIPDYRFF